MLLSNVKSLFDHVTIQYAIVKLIRRSRQPSSLSTAQLVTMPFTHKSGSRKRQEEKRTGEGDKAA